MKLTREKDNTEIITQTKIWVKDFVIALNLCPFAKHPFENELIRYAVSESPKVEEWIQQFINECNHLLKTDKKDLSTTLIILPKRLDDFYYFLDIVETMEDMLRESELDDRIQLASFHPEYQFAETDKDDVSNYTNRAPYPIIHLLRVEEVEYAIEHHADTTDIPIRNQKLMKEMGIEKLKSIMLQKS